MAETADPATRKTGQTPSSSACLTRWGLLKAERASWLAHWQEISSYVLPRQGRYFVQDRNKGWRRNNAIIDSTRRRAHCARSAAGLMGGLTSPARPWFRLGTRDQVLMANAGVKEWLSQCTTAMLDIFQRSNVYRALATIYPSWAPSARPRPSWWRTSTASSTCSRSPPASTRSPPTGRARWTRCTASSRKPWAKWSTNSGMTNCSTRVQNMYDRGQLDQWITIMHVIEPRKDRDLSLADARNMAWTLVYYELAGRDDKPLRESGFKRFNVLAPRWDVAGGDIYGNSPWHGSAGRHQAAAAGAASQVAGHRLHDQPAPAGAHFDEERAKCSACPAASPTATARARATRSSRCSRCAWT
jgi:hypothetical protein